LAEPVTRRRVVAYITCAGRLLIFRHVDHPDAGLQVPGGTLDPQETPEDGVLREAFEETGLSGLRLGQFLGTARWRHVKSWFFHLTVEEPVEETWRHIEADPSIGGGPLLFELFWVPLDSVPPLNGDQGAYLKRLSAQGGIDI